MTAVDLKKQRKLEQENVCGKGTTMANFKNENNGWESLGKAMYVPLIGCTEGSRGEELRCLLRAIAMAAHTFYWVYWEVQILW